MPIRGNKRGAAKKCTILPTRGEGRNTLCQRWHHHTMMCTNQRGYCVKEHTYNFTFFLLLAYNVGKVHDMGMREESKTSSRLNSGIWLSFTCVLHWGAGGRGRRLSIDPTNHETILIPPFVCISFRYGERIENRPQKGSISAFQRLQVKYH